LVCCCSAQLRQRQGGAQRTRVRGTCVASTLALYGGASFQQHRPLLHVAIHAPASHAHTHIHTHPHPRVRTIPRTRPPTGTFSTRRTACGTTCRLRRSRARCRSPPLIPQRCVSCVSVCMCSAHHAVRVVIHVVSAPRWRARGRCCAGGLSVDCWWTVMLVDCIVVVVVVKVVVIVLL
jgi:hypothetical protein